MNNNSKSRNNCRPIITVVTVVYNDVDGIVKTIDSVAGQNYNDFEYIVVDGASDDGSYDVIKSRNKDIDLFISEKDSGMYEAMNKAVVRAKGRYVIFMNSNDEFASENTVKEFTEIISNSDADIVFGDRIYLRKSGSQRYDVAKSEKTAFERMHYFHQSVFIKKEVLEKFPFNEAYKYAADFNQSLQLYKAGHKYQYVNKPVCLYRQGGHSESGMWPHIECLKILKDNARNDEDIKSNLYLKSFISNFNEFVSPYISDDEANQVKVTNEQRSIDSKQKKTEPKVIHSENDLNLEILKQIDFNKVLYADQYHLSQLNVEQKNKERGVWLDNLLHRRLNMPLKLDTDYVFLRTMRRDDYKTLFHEILSCVEPNNRTAVEDVLGLQSEINPLASKNLLDFRWLYHAFDAETAFDRSCLFIRLCDYLLVLQNTLNWDFKNLICFSDMQPIENLVVQYYRLLHKKTVTLQHGLYVDYKDYDSVNSINYLHHVSEYFLSWGEETKALISRYHPHSKIIICGKPIATLSEKTKPSGKRVKKYCSVVLDQRIFDQENFEMIEIVSNYAKQHDLDVNLKYHPQNNRHKYRSSGYEFHEDLELEQSEFVIGHTSSLIYELMGRNVRVFKYKSDKPCLQTPEDIMFSSAKDLQRKLEAFIDYKKYFQAFISYSGQESLDKYKKYFAEIN